MKKTCVNASCGASNTCEWKRGWPLRSGDFALLCFACGSAFENSVYCETFHAKESGWRECSICSKRLHCGCIASESLVQILDYGGVGCSSCVRTAKLHSNQKNEVPNGFGCFSFHRSEPLVETASNGNEGKLLQLCKLMEANASTQPEGGESGRKLGQDVALCLSNSSQHPEERGARFPNLEKLRSMLGIGDAKESLPRPSLIMSIGAPSSINAITSPTVVPAVAENEKEKEKEPSTVAKSSKPVIPAASPDFRKASPQEPRIARPPAEGRGKNQLLPRYWPRITDQELQQLSGDLNSKIVPLFEKVLSASDAGRIGRLVLPKACAEAYFPPISQSEGVPIRMQDVKGREWTFQFRFWPNNNSRMYVLEGVTPCIQSMQLKAGDTITFSRIDPGGRLVLGYRKATNNSMDPQDAHASGTPNPTSSGDNFVSEVDFSWSKSESHAQQGSQPSASVDKKKSRNIGPKSKRLLINNEDATELRLTWEEAQDLLRPPPNAVPSVITIDDYDFEEYDEPPVFGKRTLFTCRSTGRQDQWAQCDDCCKWRKLPVEALLEAKWTCADNTWDLSRNTCLADEEANPKDMDHHGDSKKRRTKESRRGSQESEPSGLDALASAAVMGENGGDGGEPSVGATTKHPRHRPGCTCIVCIQPPSGKGKHKPSCTCNVCMTVKRRFKTLMLRRKKRQSQESQNVTNAGNDAGSDENNQEGQTQRQPASPRQIDLNYFPNLQELPAVEAEGQRGAVEASGSSNGGNSKLLSDHEAFLATIGWDRASK